MITKCEIYDIINNVEVLQKSEECTYSSSYYGNPETIKGYISKFEGRRLIRLAKPDINEDIQYTYNDRGLRTNKVIISTDGYQSIDYYYEGDRLISYRNNENKMIYIHYDETGKAIGFHYEGNEYIYVRDSIGNIVKIMDINGQVVAEYAYNAWGEVVSEGGNNNIHQINILMYKGYVYDRETKFYYCQSRYYNPQWCRWINADDISFIDQSHLNGLNLFAYCYNDPVMYMDPSGHSVLMILASLLYLGLMGAAASVTVQAITDIVQGNEFDINNYLIAAVSGFVGGALGFINPYLGSITQAALYTGLSMKYKEYQGKADYVWQDYTFAIIASIAVSCVTTIGFRKIVKKTNSFETAVMFGDDLPTWFDCGNKVFFEMLVDLIPYYLTYSLASSASGLFFDGIPEYVRKVVALNRLGLSWGQAIRYAF